MSAVTLKISRYRPARIDPPAFFSYQVQPGAGGTVLDALEQIRIHQEPSLMYRRACHHAACGTCALTVNGKERLACRTRLADLDSREIVLAPLGGFARVADLVTSRRALFRCLRPEWSCLRPDDRRARRDTLLGGPERPMQRLEACIECGCCVSACPVARDHAEFVGPAALAAINRERQKNRRAAADMQAIAGDPHGEPLCQRAVACSRVCPAAVYPARHILELRRARRGG